MLEDVEYVGDIFWTYEYETLQLSILNTAALSTLHPTVKRQLLSIAEDIGVLIFLYSDAYSDERIKICRKYSLSLPEHDVKRLRVKRT